MDVTRVPVGVLVSGSGSNLQALLDDASRPDAPFRVAAVVSDRPGVRALDRAEAADVPAAVVPYRRFRRDRAAFEDALLRALRDHDVAWVACAGFMRVLTARFLQAFPHRVLNIHPALLPSFPGLHGPRQALDAGVTIAGCTVHIVDSGVDTGPIVAQAAVPVLPHDTEERLARRILAQEHRLYPRVVRWAAEGRLILSGARVHVAGDPPRFLWSDAP